MASSNTTPKRKRRLGKGLHAIVGESNTKQIANTNLQNEQGAHQAVGRVGITDSSRSHRVLELRLEVIDPGSHQPRTRFDDAALSALADSIQAVGVIQPVVVRPSTAGRYELIAGERRWRASKLAGLATIPAIVRESDDRAAAESALIENVQREDLNPIERAEGLRGLIDRFGLTQQEVASRVGLDRSSVTNLLRLLDLEPEIRSMLESGALALGHGKVLLSMPPGEPRVRRATDAAGGGWSVRRLESETRNPVKTAPGPNPADEASVEMRDLEKRLGEHLGTKVRLRADQRGRGTMVIRFFGLDHFDDLMSRLGFRETNQTEP